MSGPHANSSLPPRKPRLLIVDDQPRNIHVIAEALRDAHDISVATTGAKALELAASQPVDLIILDVVMPDLNGFEVCRRLKANPVTSEIPVIFVTAPEEMEEETQGFSVGGVDYITKPVRPPVVRARVRTHLELKQSRDLLNQQARELAKQNEILQENVRLKDDVERISRHDLKTPLNSIISLSHLLREEQSLAPAQTAMLHTIEQSGYRVLEMINRTLDLFKMEQGTYHLAPATLDIRAVVEKVLEDLRPLQGTEPVRCVVTEVHSSHTFHVLGEELLCYSMLANLLKNAVEASPPHAAVEIHLIGEPSSVVVSIKNEGAVPAELRASFFSKYATAGKRSGTGLGTYSARLMAETQGGTIALQAGETATTINVRLLRSRGPAVAVPCQDPSWTLPDQEEWPPLRILLVDDDADSRMILRRFLDHPLWMIDEAGDGATALRQCEEKTYDFIFLDLELPDFHGTEVVSRIRAGQREGRTRAHNPIIMALSSHSRAEMGQRALDAGYDLYFEKPVRRPDLLCAIFGRTTASSFQDPLERVASDVVSIDGDLEPLIAPFLERKKLEAEQMRAELREDDVAGVRRLGHRLKGSFEMYGFDKAAALCRRIEDAATRGARPELLDLLDALHAHLANLEIRYAEVRA